MDDAAVQVQVEDVETRRDYGAMIQRAHESEDVQWNLCQPDVNPDWAAYFATRFCRTLDDQRGGRIAPIPAWPMVLRYVRTLDFRDVDDPRISLPPANILHRKSRKVLATWIDAGYYVGCLMFRRGWAGFATSKTENYVDDSGHTVQSYFGRMRFIVDHLPPFLQSDVSFAYMRAVCERTGSSAVGEAPTFNAGRAGSFTRAYVGEIAHIPHSERLHGALDEACPHGKIYESTPYGTRNAFSRISKDRPGGWRIVDTHWKDHPIKGRGLRREEDPKRIELYGPLTSPWFERAVEGKTPEQVAQELNLSEQKSVPGRIYPEFDRDVHVSDRRIPYDPRLPLVVSIDFGHARKTVAALMQPVLPERKMRIIAEYVGEHRRAGENARDLIAKIRSVGYSGDLDDLDVIPDPSALAEELSGVSTWSWYKRAGFTSYRYPLIAGADSVSLGISVVRSMVAELRYEIDPECVTIIEGFENYHRPVDRITGDVTSNKPEHDVWSHPMDTVRYGTTGYYVVDDDAYDVPEERVVESSRPPKGEDGLLRRGGVTAREARREGYSDDDEEDDDDPAFVGHRTVTSSLSRRRF